MDQEKVFGEAFAKKWKFSFFSFKEKFIKKVFGKF